MIVDAVAASACSVDALAEFQTLDSYRPDYGIGSGGTIAMVIKSGTRNWHDLCGSSTAMKSRS
jgi:hypothetical protein